MENHAIRRVHGRACDRSGPLKMAAYPRYGGAEFRVIARV